MNNRRQFIVNMTMAAGALTVLKPLKSIAGFSDPYYLNRNKLVLLHTANLNSQWQALAANEKYVGLGGIENLSAKINAIRNEKIPVLLVDAGNIINQAKSDKDQLAFYKAVSALNYDAVIPGISDMQKGAPHFYQMAKESGLKVAGANVQPKLIYDNILPYYILNKGNLQVAVIDAGTYTLKRLDNPRNVAVAISKTATLLKEKINCVLTVCLLQEDLTKTESYANASTGVDIIISTISCHSIYNTKILRNNNNREVMISFAGSRGTMMNRIDIAYNNTMDKINVKSKLELIGVNDDQYTASIKKYDLYNA